jgi:hypothetical protein
MSILGTYLFGISHYANRGTVVSLDVVQSLMLIVLAIAAIADRTTRSSESRARHTE